VNALVPGQTIERYRIDGEVARGGMGVVYRAWDVELDHPVALKVIREDALAAAPPALAVEIASRFAREGRVASGFTHPSFCRVYRVLEVDGVGPMMVMEWIAGTTLHERMQDAAVGLERRIAWLRTLAVALSDAHTAGIVHRDFKPANVIVTPDERIKIVDFGLAKRAVGGADATADFRTATGVVLGTPSFMAPEQELGLAVDARADQFAWGVVATQVLEGSTPGQAVEALVRKARSNLRIDRFPTMRDLVEAFDAAWEPGVTATLPDLGEEGVGPAENAPGPDTPSTEPPPPRRARRRGATETTSSAERQARVFVLALVGAILVGGWGAVVLATRLRRPHEAKAPPEASVAELEATPVVAIPSDASAPATPPEASSSAPRPSSPSPSSASAHGIAKEGKADAGHVHPPASVFGMPLTSVSTAAGMTYAAPPEPPAARPIRLGPRTVRIPQIRTGVSGYEEGQLLPLLQRGIPAFERCLATTDYEGPAATSTTIVFVAAEDGTIHDARALGMAGHPRAERCLAGVMNGIRFPPYPRSKPVPLTVDLILP